MKISPTARPMEVRKMMSALALGASAPALIPAMEMAAKFQWSPPAPLPPLTALP